MKQQIICGAHAIEEALKADQAIDRIIMAQSKKKTPAIHNLIAQARRSGVKVQFQSPQQLEQSYPEATQTGILAIIQSVPLANIEDLDVEDDPFILIVDHIEDPYNFGAMLRSAEIFGVTAVIFPKDRNCQLTPGVMKAASGATAHLKLIRVTNIAKSIPTLKEKGYWIYGADANQGENLHQAKLHYPAAVVAGNESKGISRLVSKACDAHLKIPSIGKTDSLNVSVAMGIIFYQFSLQK